MVRVSVGGRRNVFEKGRDYRLVGPGKQESDLALK